MRFEAAPYQTVSPVWNGEIGLYPCQLAFQRWQLFHLQPQKPKNEGELLLFHEQFLYSLDAVYRGKEAKFLVDDIILIDFIHLDPAREC